MDKINSLTGIGRVYLDDKLLGTGNYQIDVYQEFTEGNTMQGPYRIPGLKRIVGSINGAFPIGTLLKLVTAQGQTLNFFIADSNGRIEASGPFLNSDGKPIDLAKA